jgi:chemosensory pili system protein ChpC
MQTRQIMASASEKQTIIDKVSDLIVRCLVLPLNNISLLVPNTLIAEVIEYKAAEASGQTPEWLTGILSWRGRKVPVISFERLIGRQTALMNEGRRYVICNTVNPNSHIPFIALEVQGIPHLVMVKNDMLEHDSKSHQAEPAVLAHLRLNEENVLVPNMEVLEKMLVHLGITANS